MCFQKVSQISEKSWPWISKFPRPLAQPLAYIGTGGCFHGPRKQKMGWHIASPFFTVTFCLLSNRLLSGGSISIRGLLSSGAILFSGGGLFLLSRRLILNHGGGLFLRSRGLILRDNGRSGALIAGSGAVVAAAAASGHAQSQGKSQKSCKNFFHDMFPLFK